MPCSAKNALLRKIGRDDSRSRQLCHSTAPLLVCRATYGALSACRTSLERWFPKAFVLSGSRSAAREPREQPCLPEDRRDRKKIYPGRLCRGYRDCRRAAFWRGAGKDDHSFRRRLDEKCAG